MKHYLIIGSGVVAANLAKRILESTNAKVTMFEAGPMVRMRDRRLWLDYLQTGKRPYDHLGDDDQEHESRGQSKFVFNGSRLFARGGSTLHWGGYSPRFKPEDFKLKTNFQGHLPDGATIVDWPISYADLEPFYCEAESILRVQGSNETSEYLPWRSQNYPVANFPHPLVDRLVIERGFKPLNWNHSHFPIARSEACVTFGTCKYCPTGARFSADQILDKIAAHKNFQLMTETPVRSISLARKEMVNGVYYFDKKRHEPRFFAGDVVIVAAGAFESTKLLLASRSQFWPEGIGKFPPPYDHLGRNFFFHPYIAALGETDLNPDELHLELDFSTVYSRQFDTTSQQKSDARKMIFWRSMDGPLQDLAGWMDQNASAKDLRLKAKGTHRLGFDGLLEEYPFRENRIELVEKFTRFGTYHTAIFSKFSDGFAKALDEHLANIQKPLKAMGYHRIVFAHMRPSRADHAGGLVRMSQDEKDGVVDSNLRVHSLDNLYVCSNAVFPSGAACNPTLTVVALSCRLARHLLT